ncbi:hypothetical protein AM493_04455 [Flavobacterium akiainvivens]|uniref:Uncharacterized protein n=1 Tax=Flavobacterium akiainvivens TaxID=1202724 RepID=A0A0M9VHB1_9FLAO|nr:hypothetical protein AM493_04455 [Flavobacterium akiainvivens]
MLFSLASFAQNTAEQKKDSAYTADYRKLRTIYVTHVESKYKNNPYKLTKVFIDKSNYNGNIQEIFSDDKLIQWVRQHIGETDFKNIEEAEAEWAKAQSASRLIAPEDNEFYKTMFELSKVHGMEIVTDVMMNKGVDGEDIRQETGFIDAEKKLAALIKKQQDSDSYREWRSLETAYMKKANFVSKRDKLENGESIYGWVERNLSKTMFSSAMQAKKEWLPLEKAKKAEMADNAEYHEFYLYAVERFGPYVFTDAMDDFLAGN